VLGAPAQAADRVIASSGAFVSPVEAYGGNVVWGEVAVGRSGFAYFVRDASGTRRLPLEDRVTRVDLGAQRGGGTRAVFVRCPRPSTRRPLCVIRSYDFRTRVTRTVSSLLRFPGTEGVPSVWNDRFAFTRSGRGLFATGPLRAVTRAKTVATDLRGSRVAYITSVRPGPEDEDGVAPETTMVRVAKLPAGPGRVRSCFIARATNGPTVELSNVALTATHVYWLRRDLRRLAPTPGTIRRRRLPARGCPTGPEQHSREIPRLRSFAVDRRRFFYTTNNKVWEATDPPLSFTR